jgi:hypothetical protein
MMRPSPFNFESLTLSRSESGIGLAAISGRNHDQMPEDYHIAGLVKRTVPDFRLTLFLELEQ